MAMEHRFNSAQERSQQNDGIPRPWFRLYERQTDACARCRSSSSLRPLAARKGSSNSGATDCRAHGSAKFTFVFHLPLLSSIDLFIFFPSKIHGSVPQKTIKINQFKNAQLKNPHFFFHKFWLFYQPQSLVPRVRRTQRIVRSTKNAMDFHSY